MSNIPFALDPAYELPKAFAYFFPDHAAVLIFFLLSGYVIGLTNAKSNNFNLRDYIKKRAVRIYPIYIVAVFISLIPLKQISFIKVIGNLLFLQNFTDYFGISIPPLASNGPLWSLNYEVLYYLLFILVIKYRPQLYLIAVLLVLFIWMKLIFNAFPLFISCYSTGAIYWLTGLWLAWNKQQNDYNHSKKIISLIFVFCASHSIQPIDVAFSYIKIDNMQNVVGSIASDFFTYPIYLYFFMLFLNKKIPIFLRLYLASFKTIILGIIGYLIFANRFLEDSRWWMGAIFFALSFIPINPIGLKKTLPMFVWLGGISYALYLIHYPIIMIIKEFPYFPSGSLISYSFRILILLLVVIGLSFFLEKKFQPVLTRFLSTRSK